MAQFTSGAVNRLSTQSAARNVAAFSSGASMSVGSRAYLPIWAAALQNVRNGVSNATILALGDSVVVGVGSKNAVHTNNRAGSWPTQLAALFNAAGIPARCDWLIGDGNSAKWDDGGLTQAQRNAQFVAAEPRAVLGGDWYVENMSLIGGFGFRTDTSTASLDWTSSVTCDRVEIGYIKGSGPRSFEVYADDVLVSTIDAANATTVFALATVNLPRAAQKISIKRASGVIRIAWIKPYDTQIKQVIIGNAGRGSVGMYQLGDTALNANPLLSSVALQAQTGAHLTITNGSLNDAGIAANPTTVFKPRYQNVITAGPGDTLLTIQHPRNPADETGFTFPASAYQQVIRDLGSENNKPVIDLFALFGTYASAQAKGWYYDSAHLLEVGYGQEAAAYFSLLFWARS